MKKYIIISILTLFFTNVSYAGSATMVNTGSDTGGFHQVLTMVADNLGSDTDFIQANNPVVAGTYFDKKNVLTMWSTEWPGDNSLPSVVLDRNTIVAVQAYETILCSRTYNSLSEMNGTVKIATWGESPAVSRFLENLGNENNVNFVIVPYDGSGATTRGYLGKDADTIFTIQTKQSKVEADGNCFAFSGEGDLDFAFVDVLVAVNPENGALEEFRNTVSELITTEEWQSAFAGTETYVLNDNNASALVNKVNAAITLNSN
jgi:hypothetical protein